MKLQLIAVLVLVFLGLFLHPFSYGFWDFFYKFLIFIVITYLLYRNFQQQESDSSQEPEEIQPKKQIPTETEVEEFELWNVAQLIQNDPVINKFLIDQFTVLSSFLIPDQGWIFYYNYEKKLKVLNQKSISDSIINQVPDEVDIKGILQIIETRNDILIEDNLQNANQSFEYYSDTNYSAVSFIGIPIPMSEGEKLFITFDSKAPEQFNHQDSDIIEKIVSGIRSTINFRLKSISLLSKTKYDKKLLDFSLKLNSSNIMTEAISNLTDLVSEEFEAERLTISTFKPNSDKAIIRKVIGQIDIFPEETEFLLEDGLTGWVIGKKKSYYINDLEKGDYFIPRYSKQEKSNFGLRSFLGVPLIFEDTVFGAISLEHSIPDKYSNFEKNYLQKIAELFTTIFLRKIN